MTARILLFALEDLRARFGAAVPPGAGRTAPPAEPFGQCPAG